ncbi:WW domain-containing adapter protein with coiled-coil [Chelonia mydas]|uniref:WW domain-containing adapter protein with coiled-coil n=1 Tax=Chelonia mydas TaxID=8469 RepID=M7B7U1_CHEMY|nr:WW domain-containing adapter protein with coiled-coil [Chelonia mydas]
MRDTTDPSPPNKMLRRSDSPENKYGDSTGHSKAKSVHTHRVRERDGDQSMENFCGKGEMLSYDSADDWSEHISSSGKKYYYNCRTEVSQWEKPKEWLEREQRQKEASKISVNSFPKDRDYRREVMQATAASGFASGMEDKHSSDASSILPQNILSQTSRHNDRDYRLPRAETHSSSTPVQHPIKPVVHPTATPSTVPPTPFSLQSDHQPKKSFDANGASTLSKLPTPTSSIPSQKTDRKESASVDKSVSHSCTTPSTSSASGLNPTSAPATSTVPVSPVPQSPIPPLLQDPNLLRQLLPALQATLQLNNSSVDISKINEAQPSNQSPMSLTSDASSPRSYVSPRISTPQTNTVPLKPLMNTPPVSSQPKVTTPGVKQGPASQSAPQQPVIADKQTGHEPASPRSLQRSRQVEIFFSQRSPSPAPNHTSSTSASNSATTPQNASVRPTCSLTPTLAAHFNENLIKHVQGWPADHAEKQASRLREEAHNMGSVHMSEICTELKNLRSLVRVCEIQATLREQSAAIPALFAIPGAEEEEQKVVGREGTFLDTEEGQARGTEWSATYIKPFLCLSIAIALLTFTTIQRETNHAGPHESFPVLALITGTSGDLTSMVIGGRFVGIGVWVIFLLSKESSQLLLELSLHFRGPRVIECLV